MDQPARSPSLPESAPEASRTPQSSKKYLLVIFIAIALFLVGFLLIKNISSPALNKASSSTSSPAPKPTPSTTPVSGFNKSPVAMKVQIQSTDSGKVKGTLTVTNKTNQTLSDLYYDAVLNAPDNTKEATTTTGKKITVGSFSNLLISASEQDFPNLDSNQTKTVNFEIPYSPHLHPGKYRITMELSYKPTNALDMDPSTTVDLSGDGNFLNIYKCADVVGNNVIADYSAPVSTPSNKVMGRCEINNPTNKSLTLRYTTDYGVMGVFGYPVSAKTTQTSQDTITLNPGETKVVTLALPEVATPQVYEALITFIDSNNNPTSPPLQFRWTVPGPSANIADVVADKDYYASGDTAHITVVDSPSMDLYWATPASPSGTILKNPKVVVLVTSQNGASCGQSEQKLPIPTNIYSWNPQSVSVKITQNCQNPTVTAQIFDGTTKLADFGKPYLTSSTTLATLQKTPLNPKSPLTYLLAIVFVVLFITLLVVLFKKQGPVLPLIIFTVTVSSIVALYPKTQVRADYYSPSSQELDCSDGTTGWTSFVGSAYNSGNNTYASATAWAHGPGRNRWCANEHPYTAITVNFGGGYGSYDMVPFPPSSGPGDIFGPNTEACQGGCSYNFANGTYQANGFTNSYSFSTSGGSVTLSALAPSVDIVYNFSILTIHGICNSSGNITGNNGQYLCYFGASNSCGSPTGVYHWDIPRCSSPDPSTVCAGQTYRDIAGNICNGTKVCDTTPPQVSITNPPADTCYKGPTGSNGTPWSNTQPILVRVDDTHNSQGTSVISSGISNVSIKVINLANNTVTSTINGSLSSGSNSNGTYSVNIPSNSTTFPSNGGRYSITAYASDNASHTSNTPSSSFTFDLTGTACQPPHIQTQNGDVHSQGNVGN